MSRSAMRFSAILALATLPALYAYMDAANGQGPAAGFNDDNRGAGGFGGGGGSGGADGYGGGGGGFGGSVSRGAVAAHGEYVYVTKYGRLYQYAAYDLKLIKTIALDELQTQRRNTRRRAIGSNSAAGSGGRGGEGGQGAEGGNGGAGGQGGAGGEGGGFGYWAAGVDSAEDVAAFGEFVFVLQGDKLHKLAAEDLTTLKTVKIKRKL